MGSRLINWNSLWSFVCLFTFIASFLTRQRRRSKILFNHHNKHHNKGQKIKVITIKPTSQLPSEFQFWSEISTRLMKKVENIALLRPYFAAFPMGKAKGEKLSEEEKMWRQERTTRQTNCKIKGRGVKKWRWEFSWWAKAYLFMHPFKRLFMTDFHTFGKKKTYLQTWIFEIRQLWPK